VRRSLIERFLMREDVPLQSYRAIRRLQARNARFKADGWLEAETALTPGRGLAWTLISEGGSGYVRNRVLKKALDGEAETLRTNAAVRGALAPENYDFIAGEGLRVTLRPKREDLLLVSGSALFSEDADLLEVSGRLTKNPSFWTRNVDVRRTYARIAGVRVPIAMESTAQVRIAGPSRFEMSYRYLEINGVTVTAEH
jgi:hypothetical protein